MDKVKILIVDDHAILRDGIRALLGVHDEIEVVGEASDGRECIRKALESKPDVILMDLVMPGMDGLEATRRIRKKLPKAKVLFLTQYESKEYVRSAMKAGSHGYIPKKAVGTELINAILTVSQGNYYLYPTIAAAIVEGYTQQPSRDSYDLLSAREREILQLIAEGNTSRIISEMLSISLKTAFGHRTKIMQKLNIQNRTELIKYAMRKGIVPIEKSMTNKTQR
jgi:two-component system response regulator NreC